MLVTLIILPLLILVFAYYKRESKVMRLQHSYTTAEIHEKLEQAHRTRKLLSSQSAGLLQQETNYKLLIIKEQVNLLAAISDQT